MVGIKFCDEPILNVLLASPKYIYVGDGLNDKDVDTKSIFIFDKKVVKSEGLI